MASKKDRPPRPSSQVIDLISLKPFDMATIAASVKKTRRVLIVEECMKTGGIGASLSAVISESLFNELDHQARGIAVVSAAVAAAVTHSLPLPSCWGLLPPQQPAAAPPALPEACPASPEPLPGPCVGP